MDPAGQVSVRLHSTQLLHQSLALPPPKRVLLFSHKQEEESLAQGEEGRQVFYRQLRLGGKKGGKQEGRNQNVDRVISKQQKSSF